MQRPFAAEARKVEFLTGVILTVVPTIYWLITGHVWEDFLITFRQAANLLEGNGLTYHEGTRLHSFTSPLNVLVPALMGYLAGTTEFTLPLALYNIVSVACLATGGLLTVRLLIAASPEAQSPWLALAFPFVLAFSVKVTAYAVNGQEAGFWILFLAVSFIGAWKGYGSHWWLAGIGWGGLMWTRPDSPLHITLFGIAALLIPLGGRRSEILGILKAGALCTLIYLPWFAWAWLYYGSPVPQTVVAKAGAYGGILSWGLDFTGWVPVLFKLLGSPFLPIYAMTGGWPWPLVGAAAGLTILIGIGWILFADRLLRLAGFLFLGSLAYLCWMNLTASAAPWYFPPPVFFGAVAATRLLQLTRTGAAKGILRTFAGIAAALAAVALFYSMAGSIRQIEFQQRVVENGVRKQVGLYLREHMRPGDRVYLEPIGYIGYYSDAVLLDYPGLVSEAVVRARRETGADFHSLPAVLEPEWIVVRFHHVDPMMAQPEIGGNYQLVASIDERKQVREAQWLPGRNYILTDSAFFIFRRNEP